MTWSRVWLAATVPLFVVGVGFVVKLALGLARSTREAVVATLPFVAEQGVTIPSEGRYSVFFQGTLGQRGLGDVRVEVVRAADGARVTVEPVIARTKSTGLDGNTRLELFAFSANAGPHVMRLAGIDASVDYGRNRVIVAHQARAPMVISIVALVLAGAVTIASLVASILLLVRA